MQPQGHVQVFLNIKHFGMNAQEALDAPRFCIDNLSSAFPLPSASTVILEEGLNCVDELVKMGHRCKISDGSDGTFGRGQIIENLDGTVYFGGSDRRGDGFAAPSFDF